MIPDGWEVELGKTDLDGLRAHCPAMVTIKYQFMVDHWVVVQEVKENGTVVVGDPLVGSWLTYAEGEFLDKWRRGYVEVRK